MMLRKRFLSEMLTEKNSLIDKLRREKFLLELENNCLENALGIARNIIKVLESNVVQDTKKEDKIDKVAKTTYDIYSAYIAAGFTPEQACEFIKAYLTAKS